MYILDTNTLIYFFKGVGKVADNLLAVSPKDIGLPSVVLYELEYGIARSASSNKRKKQLEELCALVDVLNFGNEEAKPRQGFVLPYKRKERQQDRMM